MPSLATPMDGVAFFYKKGSSMKTITISAKLVSGTVGLILCYSVSLYFFWNSQVAFYDFHIGPDHSHFTRLLHKVFGFDASHKMLGVIAAFLSVHASWHLRYKAGSWAEWLINFSLGRPRNKEEYSESINIMNSDNSNREKLEDTSKSTFESPLSLDDKNKSEKIKKLDVNNQ